MIDEEGFEVDDVEEQPEVSDMLTREQFLHYNSLEHDIKRDLMWAYHALGTKDLRPEDAEKAGCPSPGAWFIYATTVDNDLAKKSFISGPLTKLLASQKEEDQGDRAEDSRKHLDLLERLIRERNDSAPVLSRTEDSARKLALPKKSA